MPSLTAKEAQARAALLRIESYELDLDLTRGETVFGSRTTIRFGAADAGQATFADVKPKQLRTATLNGQPLDVESLADGRLPLPRLEATNELVIDADMAYSRDGEGLHRAVDPADGTAYVYAMSFLDAAPRIFGCFDQPDLKAPYSVAVSAPAGWSVLGNGAATRTEPGRWQLATTHPLATYFVTLVAGPYHSVRDEHDGIPLGLHVKASLATHLDKDAEEMLTVTRQAFDAYHGLFGIRYPFGEYHQAFVPEFNAGAMENPGCVTLRDGLVFRAKVTAGERSTRANTVVHEMAHMWFGDLVTMRWWDDLWLNESFAEYMAYRVCGDATAFTDSWLDFSYSRKRWGMAADQRPSTHPIAGNGAADAASALNDFDGISYAKGAAALKQLNVYLGDEVFLAGVRAHLSDHAYGNATLADLLQAWIRAGARDLDTWAQGWLRTPGIDTLRLAEADGVSRLHRTPPEQFPADRPHALTVAAYGTSGAGSSALVRLWQEQVEVPVLHDTAHPLVVPDARDDTWAKVRLTPRGLTTLPQVLPRIAEPLTRASVWNGLRDALRDAELDPRDYLTLLEAALPAEDEDIALSTLLAGAPALLAPLFPAQHHAERLEGLADTCLRAAPPGSARQVASARAFLGVTSDSGRIRRWLLGSGVPEGLEMDTEMRWAVVQRLAILGAIGPPDIEAELQRDTSAEGAVHAARCSAARPDAAAKERAWTAICTDADLSNYELYALCEGFWQPEQTQLGLPYVEHYFTDLPATAGLRSGWVVQQSTLLAFPRFAVAQRTVDLVEQTLGRDDLHPGVRRSVVDAGDDLRRALAVRTRYPQKP